MAKERLLLQEDELQSRAGRSAEVVDLYSTGLPQSKMALLLFESSCSNPCDLFGDEQQK